MSIPSGDCQHTVQEKVSRLADAARGPMMSAENAVRPAFWEAPPLWFRRLTWIGVVVWASTVWWFSSRTGPEIQEINIFELSDKVAHFIAFFAGAPTAFLALRWTFSWSLRVTVLVCTLSLALYGAADEYHQTFTVNRTGADVWDWTGDALGGLTGTLVCAFVYVRTVPPKISHRPASRGD